MTPEGLQPGNLAHMDALVFHKSVAPEIVERLRGKIGVVVSGTIISENKTLYILQVEELGDNPSEILASTISGHELVIIGTGALFYPHGVVPATSINGIAHHPA